MNKMELVMRVAEKTAMPQKDVKRCLDGILATIHVCKNSCQEGKAAKW